MPAGFATGDRPPVLIGVAVRLAWIVGLGAAVLQALAFFGGWFEANVDSDYLYPHVFAHDVLDGRYPFSGWTLSSAPYLVPDFLVYGALLAATGSGPGAFAAYVALYAGALAVLSGWSLARAGVPRDVAWLGGVVLVNVLLACRGFADHERYLSWLFMPGFHGGAVLAGLAQFGLWAGPVFESPGRARQWLAGGLLFLTAFSDTLVLTQFMAPLLIALVLVAGRRWRAARRLHAAAMVTGLVVVAVVGLRLLLPWLGWVNFTRVVRYAPTPAAVAGAGAQFVRDTIEVVGPNAPVFAALAAGGLLFVAIRMLRRSRMEAAMDDGRRLGSWFAGLCLVSTTVMPVVSVYWASSQHARFILPWMMMPFWWAIIEGAAGWRRTGRSVVPWGMAVIAVAAACSGAGLIAGRSLERSAFAWPYPERVEALDAFLSAQGRTRGLGDFWHAHLLNTLSRSGLRLSQLRPDGRVYFWNNNAFHHFEPGGEAAGGPLTEPSCTFIVMDGLDAAAIEARYGTPAAVEEIAGETVWLYDGDGARRIGEVTGAEIRARLSGTVAAERLPVPR